MFAVATKAEAARSDRELRTRSSFLAQKHFLIADDKGADPRISPLIGLDAEPKDRS